MGSRLRLGQLQAAITKIQRAVTQMSGGPPHTRDPGFTAPHSLGLVKVARGWAIRHLPTKEALHAIANTARPDTVTQHGIDLATQNINSDEATQFRISQIPNWIPYDQLAHYIKVCNEGWNALPYGRAEHDDRYTYTRYVLAMEPPPTNFI